MPRQKMGIHVRQNQIHRPKQWPLLELHGLCNLIPGAGEI